MQGAASTEKHGLIGSAESAASGTPGENGDAAHTAAGSETERAAKIALGTAGATGQLPWWEGQTLPPRRSWHRALGERMGRSAPASEGRPAVDKAARIGQATEIVLETVGRVRSWIPSWRRALNEVLTEAGKDAPDQKAVQHLLQEAAMCRSDDVAWSPKAAFQKFAARDAASGALSARILVGEHADHLVLALMDVDRRWPQKSAADGSAPDYQELASCTRRALEALAAALQHALLLTFLRDADAGGVGTSGNIVDYCNGWELTPDQIDTVWLWLTHDRRQFGEKPLRLFIDTEHRLVYRKASRYSAEWWATTTAPLWGGLLVFGLVAGLFALLQAAGLSHWPAHAAVKIVVLLVFVALGAGLHVASRSLSAISYDDPLKVYVASQSIDWLSLRWIGVLRAYIPITFVVATLYGAGSIPSSFRNLSTAVLAGYSADSLFRASISKVQAKAAASTANATPGAAGQQIPVAPAAPIASK